MNFSNVSTVASYSLISQTMNYNDLSQKDLDELMKKLEELKKSKKLVSSLYNVHKSTVLLHEAAHFFDNLATLSGQYLLVNTYNAINELSSLDKKASSTSISNYFEKIHKWSNKKFYKTTHSIYTEPTSSKWKYSFKKEEDNLIVLFKFNGNIVSEVPFTMESLWETNAMWAEIRYHIAELVLEEDKELQTIETAILNKKYTEYVYDPSLFLYSVCAHLTSSFLCEGDIIAPFDVSKCLATIALNLPYEYYERLKKPKGKIFGNLTKELLKETREVNPSLIYLILLENVFESGKKYTAFGRIHIKEILSINRLPNLSTLNKVISQEIEKLNIEDEDGFGEFSYRYLERKEVGKHLFNIHGIGGGLSTHPLFLAQIAEQSKLCVFQEDMDENAAYKAYEEGYDLERKMIKIYNARNVLMVK